MKIAGGGHPLLRRSPTRTVALVAILLVSFGGCASSYLSVRRVPQNPLAGPLQLVSRGGAQPTERTTDLLRRYDLGDLQRREPDAALEQLLYELQAEPSLEKTYAYAELSYVLGKRQEARGRQAEALKRFSAAVAHSYIYLFSPQFDHFRNAFDPQFRLACDLYNAALEDMLRIIRQQGRLQPGETYEFECDERRFQVRIVSQGRLQNEQFERFEFVSDFEVRGLSNRHVSYGLGVPLIGVRREQGREDPGSGYYPAGMSFPVTAVLRAVESTGTDAEPRVTVRCVLELYDPLATDAVDFAGRWVPLETDLTTPLGYYLDSPHFRSTPSATWGLLDPNRTSRYRGLYMLEAFDPHKIPVLMVHGLWSSPETWTEMINDLRSLPEIRNRYQFWTYLYPTGQPFWVSSAQLRRDLAEVRAAIDPDHHWPTLDQMVLIGHSMGGLVSRMQTVDSRDDFWRVLSDQPFDALQADTETRERLASLVFFRPNPSIRRVITLGTPHRGSTYANDYTRWLGRKLITLPTTLVQTRTRLARDNPGLFQNTEMLTISTSIDSLAPDSPVLPVLLQSQAAPWVRYHNIVGVLSDRNFLSRFSEAGDGVVAFESARLDEADSEIVVDADHSRVHQHPRSILEVRRILLEHTREVEQAAARRTATAAASATDSRLPVRQFPRPDPDVVRSQLPPVPTVTEPSGLPIDDE